MDWSVCSLLLQLSFSWVDVRNCFLSIRTMSDTVTYTWEERILVTKNYIFIYFNFLCHGPNPCKITLESLIPHTHTQVQFHILEAIKRFHVQMAARFMSNIIIRRPLPSPWLLSASGWIDSFFSLPLLPLPLLLFSFGSRILAANKLGTDEGTSDGTCDGEWDEYSEDGNTDGLEVNTTEGANEGLAEGNMVRFDIFMP